MSRYISRRLLLAIPVLIGQCIRLQQTEIRVIALH